MHDPDLIIRTSGERRLSNYLLWQSAYSELVFRDELWPDFSREALEESLAEYAGAAAVGGPREAAGNAPTARRAGVRRRGARPAIAVALFLVIEGGLVFTIGLIVLGGICLHELYGMYARARPVRLAGLLALAGLLLAAYYGSQFQILLVAVAAAVAHAADAAPLGPIAVGSPSSGSTGSASPSPTRSCCATCPTARRS